MTQLTDEAAPPLPQPPAEGRSRRLFRVSLNVLRVLATVHALLAVAQAVTIGRYLDGSYVFIKWHATTAGVLILVALTLVVVSLGYALAGGRWWPAGVCLPFFLAEGVQTGMGYSRALDVHIPLGVAIVAGAVAVAVWSWTRSAGRARGVRPSPSGVAA